MLTIAGGVILAYIGIRFWKPLLTITLSLSAVLIVALTTIAVLNRYGLI